MMIRILIQLFLGVLVLSAIECSSPVTNSDEHSNYLWFKVNGVEQGTKKLWVNNTEINGTGPWDDNNNPAFYLHIYLSPYGFHALKIEKGAALFQRNTTIRAASNNAHNYIVYTPYYSIGNSADSVSLFVDTVTQTIKGHFAFTAIFPIKIEGIHWDASIHDWVGDTTFDTIHITDGVFIFNKDWRW